MERRIHTGWKKGFMMLVWSSYLRASDQLHSCVNNQIFDAQCYDEGKGHGSTPPLQILEKRDTLLNAVSVYITSIVRRDVIAQ